MIQSQTPIVRSPQTGTQSSRNENDQSSFQLKKKLVC